MIQVDSGSRVNRKSDVLILHYKKPSNQKFQAIIAHTFKVTLFW